MIIVTMRWRIAFISFPGVESRDSLPALMKALLGMSKDLAHFFLCNNLFTKSVTHSLARFDDDIELKLKTETSEAMDGNE